ncbi:MAG: cytochrome oxidase small assembly protein [Aquabacterium sp.]|nr:cytochrome oxidase small assembly protein [Aquabacterium sp.]
MGLPSDPQRKANLRLALVLASVAIVFFVGFVAKIVVLGR